MSPHDTANHTHAVISRRDFLQYVTCAGGLSFAGRFMPAHASEGDATPRLLAIFLRGACDTDSVLFQADNSFYYDSRPTIAIGRKGLGDTLFEVANGWALHPAMSPLIPLIEKNQCAFLPFFGSGDRSRSHFQAQATMETGLLPLRPDRTPGTGEGYANRILQRMQSTHPKAGLGGICTGNQNPLACQGPLDMTHVQLRPTARDNSTRDERQLQVLRQLYTDPDSSDRVMIAAQQRAEIGKSVMQASTEGGMDHGASNRGPVDLATQFAAIAGLMRQGGAYSVAFTDIGGWDTHVNQGHDVGQLANKLSALSGALAQFAERMGAQWANTTVLVVSEFGRTFRENGNGGTDHGHATTALLAGGRPFSTRILGKTLRYRADTLNEGRDAPILNDTNTLASLLWPRLV